MDEPTTPALNPLVPLLLTLLAAHRPAFRQARPYQRCVALVIGQLAAFGRHTIAQLVVALGLGQADWSGFYRLFSVPRVDYDRLGYCFVQATLASVPADAPYQVALDGVQQPRSSRTLVGTSWLNAPRTPPWRPGIHRAQRFLHLAWLVPPSANGFSRAIPLRLLPAFPARAAQPPAGSVRREWEAGQVALRWLRETLDALGRPEQWVRAVADSVYGPAALWGSLPPRTTMLVRCAKNRALFQLPPPRHGRGRPRKYGRRAPTPPSWLHRATGWQTNCLRVRGRSIPLTYRVAGPYLVRGCPTQPVFLLVVKGVQRRSGARREPTFWLVSAVTQQGRWRLPAPPATLLEWAWQRWEIEVTHRAAKSGFGVGEAQCWTATSAVLSVQWQWWVLGVVLLVGYRAWGLGPAPTGCLSRWWGGGGRWSLGQLWQALRAELWQLGEFQPMWTRFPSNWSEMADWLQLQTPAILGARRI